MNLKNLTTTLRAQKPVLQSGLRVVQVSNVLHPRVHHNGLSFQSKRITLLISLLDTVQLGQSLIHDTCPSSGLCPKSSPDLRRRKTVSITITCSAVRVAFPFTCSTFRFGDLRKTSFSLISPILPPIHPVLAPRALTHFGGLWHATPKPFVGRVESFQFSVDRIFRDPGQG